MSILTDIKGTTDIFGRAYGHPGGIPGANAYGNSRPFETELTHRARPSGSGAETVTGQRV